MASAATLSDINKLVRISDVLMLFSWHHQLGQLLLRHNEPLTLARSAAYAAFLAKYICIESGMIVRVCLCSLKNFINWRRISSCH